MNQSHFKLVLNYAIDSIDTDRLKTEFINKLFPIAEDHNLNIELTTEILAQPLDFESIRKEHQNADYVLLICSKILYKTLRPEMLSRYFGDDPNIKQKFIPLVFDLDDAKYIPTPLVEVRFYKADSKRDLTALIEKISGKRRKQRRSRRPHSGISPDEQMPSSYKSTNIPKSAPEIIPDLDNEQISDPAMLTTPEFHRKHNEHNIFKSHSSPQKDPNQGLYPVWFCTNRDPLTDPNDAIKGVTYVEKKPMIYNFSNERGPADYKDFYFGKCDVYIPQSHEIGSLGSPLYKRLFKKLIGHKTDEPLKIANITNMLRQTYWHSIRAHLDTITSPNDKVALIYIHGYKTSFEKATLRAAQLGADLKIPLTAYFSWPSKDSFESYSADEATIQTVEGPLTDYLIDFAQMSGAEHVHILAHSMGNRALLRAVNRIANQAAAQTQTLFSQIFLAAPDVDTAVFLQLADAYTKVAKRTTLYASTRDKAIGASSLVHAYPRAGIIPPATVIDGIDTIDASDIDFTLLGHGFYSDARPVLQDIHDTIFQNLPAEQRTFNLEPVSTNNQPSSYWKIRG